MVLSQGQDEGKYSIIDGSKKVHSLSITLTRTIFGWVIGREISEEVHILVNESTTNFVVWRIKLCKGDLKIQLAALPSQNYALYNDVTSIKTRDLCNRQPQV